MYKVQYMLFHLSFIFSKLGTTGSFDVASLGLFEVNYMPDRREILLTDYVSIGRKGTETN
jgi:hypothetical protein